MLEVGMILLMSVLPLIVVLFFLIKDKINVVFYIRSFSTDNPQPNASRIGNMDYSS